MVNGKRVLVVGMARSGIDVVKLLHRNGALVTITDTKTAENIKDYQEIKPYIQHELLGAMPTDVREFDFIVMSPGVPTDLPFVHQAKAFGIDVVGEVEVAYKYAKGKFIGITGTNGKTTTTSLVGEMYKSQPYPVYVVGNIGIPVSQAVLNQATEPGVFVTELSSYQLESIHSFTPWIAALLNLTPDHLARHKSMEAYLEAKLNLVRNLGSPENFILNGDDPLSQPLRDRFPRARFFSKTDPTADFGVQHLETSAHLEEAYVVIRMHDEIIPVLPVRDIFLLGEHNLENALAAVGIAYLGGVSVEAIAGVLRTFKGVSHRNEYVDSYKGVLFYNDSKATNPEASIPALKAITSATHLIAGGMDKGSDYTPWIKAFDAVKHVYLFGETKYKIAQALKDHEFSNYSLCDNLEEAFELAVHSAQSEEVILLSPACASWDMFESFEARGDLFKSLVYALKEHAYGQ
jgi:UDP-N-acetylmuramoylalanine--D-glutamate ligase